MTNQPKILITGASGFIASNLVYQLNQLGYTNLTLVDRLGNTDKWRNLVGLKYARYLEVDDFIKYIDCETMYGATESYDVIYHLGACSSTRETDASYLMRNNYEFSVRLLHYAMAAKTRFIYASSASSYGSGTMDDSLSPTSLKPLNPYALSKNMFDQYVEAHGYLDKVVGLKYFNVFGPNSRHKGIMVDFVAKCFDQMRTQGYIEIYDTHLHGPEAPAINVRKDARDFLYVKDAVDMTVHFAFGAGKTASGLFNIGSGIPSSWFRVAAETAKATIAYETNVQVGDYVRFVSMPVALKSSFQFYTCADISKLRASSYTTPITPIDAAIKDYVTNYLMPDKRRGEVTNGS